MRHTIGSRQSTASGNNPSNRCKRISGSRNPVELTSEFVNVRATDMLDACSNPGIVYKKADIRQHVSLTGAMGNPDVVVHAAGLAHIFSSNARSNERFRQINEIGTENVARASVQAGAKHLILISSVSVYGAYTLGQYDEDTLCVRRLASTRNPSTPGS